MNAAAPAEEANAGLYRAAGTSLLRLVLGFGVFLAIVTLLAWAFHSELERVGYWFVERFGIAGMVAGTFVADGLHFPVPPQFYLLTGVTGGGDAVATVGGVLVGSILGGLMAFAIGRRLSGTRLIGRWSRAPRDLLQRLLATHGNWGLVIAGLMPLSYWLLCSVGGVLRLPYRAYGVIALMRIPRILLSYALIVVAWGAGGQ
jgi:membrane protein YqaA with SNARE-associated domain